MQSPVLALASFRARQCCKEPLTAEGTSPVHTHTAPAHACTQMCLHTQYLHTQATCLCMHTQKTCMRMHTEHLPTCVHTAPAGGTLATASGLARPACSHPPQKQLHF